MSAERALWADVLCQQIRDLGAGRRDAAAAEAWVGATPGRDFRLVCALAGIEVGPTHARLREIIASPREARRAVSGMLSPVEAVRYRHRAAAPEGRRR
ncbi:hypothetical protein [uncultured Amaricoccus sp.]|uniref:hypothetical protein n=1 Tax=uncultured Amaricoccus sp. TaxID=339341 RepID=UPI00260526A8|nr:hypothetical protein [uncultured Amaricoccus sp.]